MSASRGNDTADAPVPSAGVIARAADPDSKSRRVIVMSWFPELLRAAHRMMGRCRNSLRLGGPSSNKTSVPKPYWNHAFPASLEPETRQNPAATAAHFGLRTRVNLPHPDVGSNRHGESIMFDRIHA
jgi:hypothetical protein